ncbi:MAG: radical SAM protein [Ruminococcaceae bacterium]|nr:radical SAM protein [Oscillospiraceae bacterium]
MDKSTHTLTAPVMGLVRHRIMTDGKGVTTLAGFYGCPLRCGYCLNPQCFGSKTAVTHMTPKELYEKIRIDELYFLATGGGVTFGGGEPLLHSDFIAEFCKICGSTYNFCAETCLNVPFENAEKLLPYISTFFVDVKDTDPDIYLRYTGNDNTQVIENLKRLAALGHDDKIVIRLPLIPGYNSEKDREKSEKFLRSIGLTNFDKFTYIIRD